MKVINYFPVDKEIKSVLWWGRFNQRYSRNEILRGLMDDMGREVAAFRPAASRFGDVEAVLRRVRAPGIVWVPCFRQRDLAAACRWARRRGAKVVFDPLVSAYMKQVFERRKFPEDSAAARRLLARERKLFAMPDVVVADTPCHAKVFHDVLGVPEERLQVVYVGADESLYAPAQPEERPAGAPMEVLFYGSFIPLHGADVIVQAASLSAGDNIKWTLLGDGPMRGKCIREATGLANVSFEAPVPQELLAKRIRRADVLLGIFGDTPQAANVMPNKFFQSIASSRPVVTRVSEAYPKSALASPGVRFVPPADPQALLDAVRGWLDPSARDAASLAARRLYLESFSRTTILGQLEEALR